MRGTSVGGLSKVRRHFLPLRQSTEKSPDGDGLLTSTAKKVGGKIKGVFGRGKSDEADAETEVKENGANSGAAPAVAGAGA